MAKDSMLDCLALSFLEGIGARTANAILNHFGSASAFLNADADTCREAGLNKETAAQLQALKEAAYRRAEAEIELTRKHGVRIICREDAEFPDALKFCEDAPMVLYCKGSLSRGTPHGIAIVGTRQATLYGQEQTERLVSGLRNTNVHIVSGLALGIDTSAHEASLENKLPTWAVLAHGLEHIYPDENRDLANRIIEHGGAVISEMPLFTVTKPGLFPRRNRIIAGLSQVTVVVESSMKGGAMHTAREADSYQRTVFAVPGRNGDTWSNGCNFLIRTGKAVLLQSAEDIRQEIGYGKAAQGDLFAQGSEEKEVGVKFTPTPDQKILLDIFKKTNPISIDTLQAQSGKPVHELLPLLLQLEMGGIVKSLPGSRYKQTANYTSL
ncbi:MAG: DNA-processing protein DprA [Bacteroides sp.]|nr:DNA-processing protein DprA [Bacteroides sp.]MCM1085579.1 DNA-processing protein DprA [Bacteroides sp.]